MTIKISGRYGTTTPFERVTATSLVECRFCKGKKKIKKGGDAIVITTNSGPTGRAFACIPCADKLLENLAEELDKGGR